MKEVYKRVIKHFGEVHQKEKMAEECLELYDEICRELVYDKDNRENIIKEMADVQNCLLQMKIIYNVSDDELTKEMWAKMHRTLARMEDKNENV